MAEGGSSKLSTLGVSLEFVYVLKEYDLRGWRRLVVLKEL
jgi:hypothetical protein